MQPARDATSHSHPRIHSSHPRPSPRDQVHDGRQRLDLVDGRQVGQLPRLKVDQRVPLLHLDGRRRGRLCRVVVTQALELVQGVVAELRTGGGALVLSAASRANKQRLAGLQVSLQGMEELSDTAQSHV